MRIGLVDVDGHNFPNLALMKLSTYHKQQGHDVEFVNSFFKYDLVYKAKVFTFTEDYNTVIHADKIIEGGTGYNNKIKLDDNIECLYPDYSLYGIENTAYGFLTRGCPRACNFCIVADKEGRKSYKVADLKDFWNGQKEIKLLDPNITACKDREELIQQLIKSKARVDFTQGLDIRLMDDDFIKLITKVKVKMYHFAWDKMNQSEKVYKNLKMFKEQTGYSRSKVSVYILVNFDTTLEQDFYRIHKVKELGFAPYVMIYDKGKCDKIYRRLQRWVNNRFIFNSGNAETFEEYLEGIGKFHELEGIK